MISYRAFAQHAFDVGICAYAHARGYGRTNANLRMASRLDHKKQRWMKSRTNYIHIYVEQTEEWQEPK